MEYKDLLRWFGGQTWFQFMSAKLAPLDAAVLKQTDGRFGLLGNYGLPQCLVTTTGRKSGKSRTITLLYGTRDDKLVVVGSNFGQKHHPAWALNLEANPIAVVKIGDRSAAYTARQVTDQAEREELWQIMYDVWPAYNVYRGKSGREIKMFELTAD